MRIVLLCLLTLLHVLSPIAAVQPRNASAGAPLGGRA